MVVPTVIIIPLFLAAFVMLAWQYQQIDPRRRILNLRFGAMIGAFIAIIYYVFYVHFDPGDSSMSWIFLGLALFWLWWARYMMRRMPPRENY
jgi:hypothetical protein